MPLIIKTVGVTEYGGFILLNSILGIAFGLSSFGAGFRARRFLPSAETMSIRRDLFYPQFFFSLLSIILFSVLLIILDRPINTYFFKNEISYSSFIIPAYLFFYFLYSQGSDYFRYTSRISYMTVAGIIFPYFHIVLILFFFYVYRAISINMLIISQTLSACIIAIPCFWLIFKEIGIRFHFYNIKSLLSDIKLGFPLIINFIFDFILAGSDRYFITFYMTVTDVGFYTPGYMLGSLIIFIPKAMGTALPQLLSKSVDKKNEHEAQLMLNYAIKIFILISIPFVFGSIALGKPILSLLANSIVAEKSFWVTPIVALGTLFYGLNLLLSIVLFIRMKTVAILKMNLFAAFFNLFANAFFLYIFKSILVAAITNLVGYFLAFLYIERIVKKERWRVDFKVNVVFKSIISSVVMCVTLYWISGIICDLKHLTTLIIGIPLGIGIYIAGLLSMSTFTKKELIFVKRIVFK